MLKFPVITKILDWWLKILATLTATGKLKCCNMKSEGTYGKANQEIFQNFYKVWKRARELSNGNPILRTFKNNITGHKPK